MDKDPLYILLADDDKSDRLLFTEAFAELKIKTRVSSVKNGIELMEQLNKDNVRIPDLLFIDLNMPRKNGLECLKEIRNSKKFKEVFVVIYSTSDHKRDMEETFLNGANVYITKPNNFDKLKQVLEKAVSRAYLYRDPSMEIDNFLLRI